MAEAVNLKVQNPPPEVDPNETARLCIFPTRTRIYIHKHPQRARVYILCEERRATITMKQEERGTIHGITTWRTFYCCYC